VLENGNPSILTHALKCEVSVFDMKKGASQIISVVLLILIAVAIAGIVINISTGIIEEKKKETTGFSFYYDAKIYILTDLASLSLGGTAEPSELTLGVKRLDNEKEVKGVRFIFEDNLGGSHSIDFYENPPNDAGIIQEYTIEASSIGVSNLSEIKKVSLSLLYEENQATGILDEKELG
jgi:hypothetical protein